MPEQTEYQKKILEKTYGLFRALGDNYKKTFENSSNILRAMFGKVGEIEIGQDLKTRYAIPDIPTRFKALADYFTHLMVRFGTYLSGEAKGIKPKSDEPKYSEETEGIQNAVAAFQEYTGNIPRSKEGLDLERRVLQRAA